MLLYKVGVHIIKAPRNQNPNMGKSQNKEVHENRTLKMRLGLNASEGTISLCNEKRNSRVNIDKLIRE